VRKAFKISLLIIVIFAILIFSGITYFTNNILSEMAETRVEMDSELVDKYGLMIDSIEVTTSDGLNINAWRFSQKDPEAIAIVIHGMNGQDGASLLNFGKFFNDQNFAAFCLDLRAHGRSEGNEIGFGYTETRDVKALLDWINKQKKYEGKDIFLYGISMGGATAINSAAKFESIDMVISVSSFASHEATFLDYMRREEIPEIIVQAFKPSIRLLLALKYNTKPIANAPINTIKNVEDPIFIIHGQQDEQILVHQARELKKAAGENAKLWIVDDKKHMVVTEIFKEENQWYRDRLLEYINNNI